MTGVWGRSHCLAGRVREGRLGLTQMENSAIVKVLYCFPHSVCALWLELVKIISRIARMT